MNVGQVATYCLKIYIRMKTWHIFTGCKRSLQNFLQEGFPIFPNYAMDKRQVEQKEPNVMDDPIGERGNLFNWINCAEQIRNPFRP